MDNLASVKPIASPPDPHRSRKKRRALEIASSSQWARAGSISELDDDHQVWYGGHLC